MNKERRKRIEQLESTLGTMLSELETLRDEEQEANNAIPDSLRNSERATESDDAVSSLENACSTLEDAMSSLQDIMGAG